MIGSLPSVHFMALEVIRECGLAIARYPHAGPLLFVALAALSAALAFFSVALIVPIAVTAWGSRLTVLYLWAGWVFGGMLSYAGGRVLGRRLLLWLSPSSYSWLELQVRQRTSFQAALLLQLLLPSELLGSAFGIARYRFKHYLTVLLVGELPYAVGAVMLGDSFLSARSGLLLGVGAALTVLLLVGFAMFRRGVARRESIGI